MGKRKWHSLDHLVESVKELGGIKYLHGGIYDQSHKHVYEDYSSTIKLMSSAMEETLKRQEERLLKNRILSASETKMVKTVTQI